MASDRERMDWIARTCSTVHCNYTSPDDWSVTVYDAEGHEIKHFEGDTLREAIDEAMRWYFSRSTRDAV